MWQIRSKSSDQLIIESPNSLAQNLTVSILILVVGIGMLIGSYFLYLAEWEVAALFCLIGGILLIIFGVSATTTAIKKGNNADIITVYPEKFKDEKGATSPFRTNWGLLVVEDGYLTHVYFRPTHESGYLCLPNPESKLVDEILSIAQLQPADYYELKDWKYTFYNSEGTYQWPSVGFFYLDEQDDFVEIRENATRKNGNWVKLEGRVTPSEQLIPSIRYEGYEVNELNEITEGFGYKIEEKKHSKSGQYSLVGSILRLTHGYRRHPVFTIELPGGLGNHTIVAVLLRQLSYASKCLNDRLPDGGYKPAEEG